MTFFRFLAVCLTAVTFASYSLAQQTPPNIIVIMPDDQGYGDHGATGNTVIRTPNIDALAAESASLDQFYVCPVCSPTRASLMTGRYHHRTRVVDTFKGRSMMDPDEVTIAEVLKQSGYTTGIFGKWHLGDNYPMRPMEQGFDVSYIHKGGGLAQPSEPIENKRRYTDPILFYNGTKIQTEGYCTDLYFDEALRFADISIDQKKPFFIYLPTNAPHGPYHDVPAELLEYYKSIDLSPLANVKGNAKDQLARICAMIENVDQNVGKVRRFLDERKIADNTIVIFMVDNGPNSRRFVGPFRGMKSHVHEGGIRSPFWIRWPQELKAGHSVKQIAAHIDLMPTLLAAAGVSSPDGVAIDGRNLLPLLKGETIDWQDRHIVIQAHRGDAPLLTHHFAIRNQNWKLLHPTGFGRETMPKNVPFELYDMTADQGEANNLFDKKPEIREKMLQEYRKWFRDVSSTRSDNYAPPRIVIGSNYEPVSALTPQDRRPKGTEGWGVGGHWEVKFIGSHRYRVALNWQAPVKDSQVVLRIGESERKVDFDGEISNLEIDDVSPKAGETSVSIDCVINGKQRDPYHVIFHRLAK